MRTEQIEEEYQECRLKLTRSKQLEETTRETQGETSETNEEEFQDTRIN